MDDHAPSLAEPTAQSGTLPPIDVAGNALQLFVASQPMIDAMARDIASAQARVWLEVYIFAGDSSGRKIADALIERARAGLDVRLLYDAIGSQGTPPALLAELSAAGVRVHAFHSFLYALRNWSFFEILNRRDHRKLLVIDDQVGYFGGMNIVDTVGAVPAGSHGSPVSDVGWRDVHVRIAGPQVVDLVESFRRSWSRAHHEPIDRRPRAYRRVRLPRGTGDFVRFYDSGPGLNFTRAERVFTRLIGLARREIMIAMAYFLPPGRVLRAMFRARRIGCRLTVIVPAVSDVPLVQRATRFLYERLLKRDIEIHERQELMLHSKVMVVDGRWTVIGSCNLDPRSLETNLELLAVVRSNTLAQATLTICREELAHSRLVTPEDLARHGRWQRFLDWAAYLVRGWL